MPAIWKGTISFGLVNIPVELAAAVRPDHIAFRLLDSATNTPVKYERVRASDGEIVPWKSIVKGYEHAKGRFIVLTEKDFKAAALESSKAIEILDFVAQSEIDPRFFDTPYFLLPSKGGERSYALLREAMRDSDVVGIGKIIMRQHQHLAGIHVVGDALVLELMRFANEVVDADTYNFPKASTVRSAERTVAIQLVKSLSSEFEPEKYVDDYRVNLMRLIKAKTKGKKFAVPEAEPAHKDPKVLDLMAVLKKSLGEQRDGGKSTTTGKRSIKKAAKRVTKPAAKRVVKRATTRARRRSA